MTLRRIRLSVVVVVLTVFFLAVGAAQPAADSAAKGRGADAGAVAAAVKASQSNWVFEGCWTYWPAGPCRDIFRDAQGGYHLCRACGTTGTPNNNKCNPISSQTLATGYWCS